MLIEIIPMQIVNFFDGNRFGYFLIDWCKVIFVQFSLPPPTPFISIAMEIIMISKCQNDKIHASKYVGGVYHLGINTHNQSNKVI